MSPRIPNTRMYERLAALAKELLDEATRIGADLGLGTGPVEPRVEDLVDAPGPMAAEIREMVREALGDGYDVLPVANRTVGLKLARLASAPSPRPFPVAVVPLQKPSPLLEASIPSPPKYGWLPCFAGDPKPWGLWRASVVPLEGASYSYHGIAPGAVFMVARADPKDSMLAISAAAEAYYPSLAAVFALGPAVPGCDFSPVDEDGAPSFLRTLGELAQEYDVPLVVDNGEANPLLGPDITRCGASIFVTGSTSGHGAGLVIGTQEYLEPLYRWVRESGRPHLAPSPSGLGVVRNALRRARDAPEGLRKQVDRAYDIVAGACSLLDDDFKTSLRFRKNIGALLVEVNYEDTWRDGLGFPVFSREDRVAGTHILAEGVDRMGLRRVSVTDASVLFRSGDDDRVRKEAEALVAFMKTVGARASYPV